MARRTNLVTRTIRSTKVVALCLDTETAEPTNQSFTIGGTYPDDPKGNTTLLKKIRKTYETDTFKVVSIVEKQVEENLYGMTEEEFIAGAKVLPPRKAN